MANHMNGEYEVELDQPRTIRFGLNEIAELEQELSQDVGMALAVRGFSFDMIRKLLWTGLRGWEGNADIKSMGAREGIAFAGDLISRSPGKNLREKIDTVRDILRKALNMCFFSDENGPPKKEEGPEEKKGVEVGIGGPPSARPSAPVASAIQPSSGV